MSNWDARMKGALVADDIDDTSVKTLALVVRRHTMQSRKQSIHHLRVKVWDIIGDYL